MKEKSHEVPKIIWFLWFQGIENAPYLVKKCLSSWKKHNPGWEIRFLDDTNVKQYIDIEHIIQKNHRHVSKQVLSDLIRINLLKEYGGVWVDSTCFCCQPLDEWLDSYMSEGFFAFHRPGIDRPISNWFLVAGALA